MVEITLLPCPFCGWTHLTVKYVDVNEFGMMLYVVECDRCGAKTGTHPDKALAKDWWNRRAE